MRRVHLGPHCRTVGSVLLKSPHLHHGSFSTSLDGPSIPLYQGSKGWCQAGLADEVGVEYHSQTKGRPWWAAEALQASVHQAQLISAHLIFSAQRASKSHFLCVAAPSPRLSHLSRPSLPPAVPDAETSTMVFALTRQADSGTAWAFSASLSKEGQDKGEKKMRRINWVADPLFSLCASASTSRGECTTLSQSLSASPTHPQLD